MEAGRGNFHGIRKNSYIMERRGKIFHDIRKISHIMETTEQTTDLQYGVDTVSWPRLRDIRNPEDHRCKGMTLPVELGSVIK